MPLSGNGELRVRQKRERKQRTIPLPAFCRVAITRLLCLRLARHLFRACRYIFGVTRPAENHQLGAPPPRSCRGW